MRDAIDDLEGLLAEGESVDTALDLAARPHDIKARVLAYRAFQALGDLNAVNARAAIRKTEAGRKARTSAAVQAYREAVKLGGAGSPAEWLLQRVGEPIPADELKDAVLKCQEAWMQWQLSLIMKSDGNSCAPDL